MVRARPGCSQALARESDNLGAALDAAHLDDGPPRTACASSAPRALLAAARPSRRKPQLVATVLDLPANAAPSLDRAKALSVPASWPHEQSDFTAACPHRRGLAISWPPT
jgi:hypothetical protein